jgi:para-aminobenzoate synthetase component I
MTTSGYHQGCRNCPAARPVMTAFVERLDPPPSVEETLARFADWPLVTLFHSALVRESLGRYSFLTADPLVTTTIETVEDAVAAKHVVSSGVSAQTRARIERLLAVVGSSVLPGAIEGLRARHERAAAAIAPIRRLLAACRCETDPTLPPFQGGIAGLICYEAGGLWERLPETEHAIDWRYPLATFGMFDWVIAWDHVENAAWLIVQPLPEIRSKSETEQRAATVREQLFGEVQLDSHVGSAGESHRSSAPDFALPRIAGLQSNFDRDSYMRAVERTIRYIRAGDIFQANISQRLSIPAQWHPVDLYRRLVSVNPAPFAAYFDAGEFQVISASPERFLRVDGDEVETRPIKGTRARRTVPEADLFTRDELRESEKDRAENVMIVDLLRNDLSRVCRPGSIRVPQLCAVETYETVQHLVSEVRGRLRDGKDFFDLIAATFPGGSITGAPKIRAMEIITELERVPRGPYCGSLFYLGFDGRADSSILIRTFTQSGGWLRFPVGGGITAESDLASEYEETLHKAEGLLRALKQDA